MRAPPTPEDRAMRRWLAAAVGAGIAARVALLLAYPTGRLLGDESDYLARGVALAASGHLEGLARAPGYVWFIAAFAALPGDPATAVRLAQAVLGGAGALLVHALARPFVDRRSALAAAWIFALYPTTVAFCGFLYAETLYVLVFLAASACLVRAWSGRRPGYAAAAGFLLGASALVRSVSLPLAPAALGWWFVREKPRAAARGAGLFAAGLACAVLPYAVRNHVVYGGWIPVDTSAARTLWHANHIEYRPGFDWGILDYKRHSDGAELPPTGDDPVRSYYDTLRRELTFVRENPVLILGRVPEKLGALWNPTSFAQRAIARGSVVGLRRSEPAALVASLLISTSYAAVMVLGIFGVLHAEKTPLRTWFLLSLGVFGLVYAFMVCQSRYRLPLMPFLMIFAADALVHWRREFVAARAWRTWAAFALVATLLVLWWPYLPFVLLERVRPW